LLESSKDWGEHDYPITVDLDSRSSLQRAQDNLDAIVLLKQITSEGREATIEEKAVLARFSGWGDSEIANKLFGVRWYSHTWQELKERLEVVLTPAEREAASVATQYSHFTSGEVIEAIYAAVERMGFVGVGRVLDAGAGTGRFRSYMPAQMRKRTHYTAIENDPITGGICKLLHGSSDVRVEDFTKTHLPKGFYDLAVGNYPFSKTAIVDDPEYGHLRLSTHNYFITKVLDRLRPGGIAAVITSRYTMDAINPAGRAVMAKRADLVGAIRLPKTAFKNSSGTEVVTDILFLRRRAPGEDQGFQSWLETVPAVIDGKVSHQHQINEYFARHPEMVLGQQVSDRGMYGDDTYTIKQEPGTFLSDLMVKAIANLPADVYRPRTRDMTMAEERPIVQVRDRHRKEGRYFLCEGQLYRVIEGVGVPVKIVDTEEATGGAMDCISRRKAAIMVDYIAVRDARENLLTAQASLPAESQEWRAHLAPFVAAYEHFVKQWGVFHRVTANKAMPNMAAISGDPEAYTVAAIEHYDSATGVVTRARIFSERVINAPTSPVVVTPADALAWSLNTFGFIDIELMARKIERPAAELVAALGEAIYEDPRTQQWQLANEYLSGDVVTKLADAERAAKEDPNRYGRNLEALKLVQPKPLGPSDIHVKLGVGWVDSQFVDHFAREVVGLRYTSWQFDATTSKWSPKQLDYDAESLWRNKGINLAFGSDSQQFATARMRARDIFIAALNNVTIRVTDKVLVDGQEKDVVNAEATEAANAKVAEIHQAWLEWVWKDNDRAMALVDRYNSIFNRIVPPKYDGSHLTFPGMSDAYKPRDLQKRAVWRAIVEGNTYFGHSVGAGKTLEAIMLAMTERRLGLIKRPMFVVPGHVLGQFTREFLDAFPGAELLVATEDNFHASRRREFLGRIQSSTWDGIIITHAAFGRIALSPQVQSSFLAEEIAHLQEWLASKPKSEQRRNHRVKAIARKLEKMKRKLAALANESTKDKTVYFDDLGIDRLIVDEAHNYRKLSFETELRNLRGVDPEGSQRAMDLLMKVRYLNSINPGRAIVGMSGTPITNTLGEMYSLFRLYRPEILERQGTQHFDQWAAVFGETVTQIEQTPSGGYAPATRFARFVNLPELVNAFRSVVDVVRPSELRGVVNLPTLVGGGRQLIVSDASDALLAYQRKLEARMQAIKERQGKPKKGDDILLNVITDGIFAAIDDRFFDPELPPDPQSKLNRAIAKIFEVYQRTSDRTYIDQATGETSPIKGATQMVFLDRRKRGDRPFDAYEWIRSELIRLGVPDEEIAFIQDYSRDKKKALIDAFNAGKVRILIGSTVAMGEGTNGQVRLIAAHHLDAPWFPAAVEQREGRIVRYGNQNSEVEIYAYSTAGTYDSAQWQILETKAGFIDQALRDGTSIRTMEDLDNSADQYALAKAMTTADPRILKKVGLEQEIRKLERLERAHFDDQYRMRAERRAADAHLKEAHARIARLEEVIAKRAASDGKLLLGQDKQEHPPEIAAAKLYQMAWALWKSDRPAGKYTLGQIGPFRVRAYVGDRAGQERISDRPRVWIDFGNGIEGKDIKIYKMPNSADDLYAEIMNCVAKWPDEALEQAIQLRDKAVAELKQLDASINAPFRYAEILAERREALKAIDAELLNESLEAKKHYGAKAAATDQGDADYDFAEDDDSEQEDEDQDSSCSPSM
jgi:N12 class adenine-specific DNA methylase